MSNAPPNPHPSVQLSLSKTFANAHPFSNAVGAGCTRAPTHPRHHLPRQPQHQQPNAAQHNAAVLAGCHASGPSRLEEEGQLARKGLDQLHRLPDLHVATLLSGYVQRGSATKDEEENDRDTLVMDGKITRLLKEHPGYAEHVWADLGET